MKRLIFLFCVLISISIFAQRTFRKEIAIPDIPGYLTLKCDFHMHTVFSDGKVWPTIRVEEAWLDGLDVISITDHVEHSILQNYMKIDRNYSFEIAKKYADEVGLILIKGAEIARGYPMGHYNCFFISDAHPLNTENDKLIDAIYAAVKQNAVIQWNHPGWKQPGRIPVWYDFQNTLFENKMMQMIEIVNGVDENSYYPLAHQWALDKNLAISANSDAHDPIYMSYGDIIHRPMTLVFAKERSVSGVKEAILAGRTAVYHFDTLMGREEFLLPLFQQSLIVKTPVITIKGTQRIAVILENISDIPLIITFKGGGDEYAELGSGTYIPANGSARITIKGKKEDFAGERTYTIPCVVNNYYTGPRKGMNASFEFKVKFEKK